MLIQNRIIVCYDSTYGMKLQVKAYLGQFSHLLSLRWASGSLFPLPIVSCAALAQPELYLTLDPDRSFTTKELKLIFDFNIF